MTKDGFLDVKTQTICSEVKRGDKTVVLENIRYPEFAAREPRYENLAAKMNRFYSDAAKRYSAYARTKLARRAFSAVCRGLKPYGAVMNYYVSYCEGDFVSVVVDISGFDGEKSSCERVSHNWSAERRAVMPPSYFIDGKRTSKKYIEQYVLDTVRKNMKNPFFGYYGDAEKLAKRHLRAENFYFVPKGAAFFINAGILCDEKYGPSVFVIPFDRADGVLKFVGTTDGAGTYA